MKAETEITNSSEILPENISEKVAEITNVTPEVPELIVQQNDDVMIPNQDVISTEKRGAKRRAIELDTSEISRYDIMNIHLQLGSHRDISL
jgi:F420-0:gamma-glutamyl ligase